MKHRAVLSDDDQTLIALQDINGHRSFVALDLATGATTGTVPAVSVYGQQLAGTSGDRRRFLETHTRHAPSYTTINDYDSRTLQLLETTRLFGTSIANELTVDSAADHCVLNVFGALYAFPLDGTDHDLSQPGTTMLRVTHGSQYVVSGDLSRAFALSEDAVVLDIAGGAHTRFAMDFESYISIKATTSASAASGALCARRR